jgi:hypothetical protein
VSRSALAQTFDFIPVDPFALGRLEPYHIVSIAQKNARNSDGRHAVCHWSAKPLITPSIVHLPAHQEL